MPLACVYHKTEKMRVVSFDERNEMVASGEWFNHPSCKTIETTDKEIKDEKQIRRRARKGRSNGEHETQET